MERDAKQASELVEYRCVADGHLPRPLLSRDFALRVHLRSWAYCPAGERKGHRWERIEATLVEDLATVPNEPAAEHASAPATKLARPDDHPVGPALDRV
ncbi:MAG: hypothetical protein ACRDGE_10950 [Candidatus Limnocylindria bacterium]